MLTRAAGPAWVNGWVWGDPQAGQAGRGGGSGGRLGSGLMRNLLLSIIA
jgi:hypothetical protein